GAVAAWSSCAALPKPERGFSALGWGATLLMPVLFLGDYSSDEPKLRATRASFRCGRTSSRTTAKPRARMPRICAAPYDRSIIRFLGTGPRSLTFTTTHLPLRRLVTLTSVPSGSSRCAAVNRNISYGSPLAQCRPSKYFPYHEAFPITTFCFCTARDLRISLEPELFSTGAAPRVAISISTASAWVRTRFI